MRIHSPLKVAAAALLIQLAGVAQADTWSWSFSGESGTFTTNGTGTASPGNYLVTDFAVLSSATGGTLGSLTGGAYLAGNALATSMPFSFDWDGSKITAWHHAGTNTFHWNAYQQVSASSRFYFFGWADGNVNDPFSAAYFDMTPGSALAVGSLFVSAAVPEPESYAMLALGLASLVFHRRAKRSSAAH